MIPPPFHPKYVRRGFTLIEMMVAVSITALLIILITQITASFLDYWPKAEGQLRKNMDARMVLELMAQDLQAAVLKGQESPPSFEWLQWRYNVDPTNPLPKTIYANPVTGMLMFFTSPADRTLTLPGNICAVAYRLSYQKPFGSTSGDKVFALYRTMVEATPTFQNVLGQTDLYAGYWQANPTLAQKDFLVANVLDFSVTFQVLQPDGTHLQLPARTALRYGPTIQVLPLNGTLQTGAKLEAIDISLTITTAQGSKRITEGHSNIEGLLKPTVDTFNRRVEIAH